MVRRRTQWHSNNGNGKGEVVYHPNRMGRPPIYNPDRHPAAAYRLISRNGISYEDLGAGFGVQEQTIIAWMETHPEFSKAVKRGWDDFAAGKIKKALAARARGYSHPEEKIFCNTTTGEVIRVDTVKHYPPDPVAIIYYLNNWSRRMGNTEWMHVNRVEHTGKDGKPIQTEDKVTQVLLKELLKKAEPEALIGLKNTLEDITCANTDPC